MKLTHAALFAAAVAASTACSKGSDSPAENGQGADMSSGTDTANTTETMSGSHPADLNANPGSGTTGVGATGVDNQQVQEGPGNMGGTGLDRDKVGHTGGGASGAPASGTTMPPAGSTGAGGMAR